MTATFHSGRFWKAFERAGMLVKCWYIAPGGGVRTQVLVRWKEPDEVGALTGARSKDFAIEYRHADMPDLAEGDELSIEEVAAGCTSDFVVREAPLVDIENGDDGTYRYAFLTRVKARS